MKRILGGLNDIVCTIFLLQCLAYGDFSIELFFSPLELILPQTFINHLLCAGALLNCVRNIKMDKTSMAVFYRLPLYPPFVKNPT